MSDDQLWADGPQTLFRPSYSSTWLACSGSLLPSRWAPDTAGIDAARGTVFHEVIAQYQETGRPDHRLGEIVRIANGEAHFEIEIDEDMFVFADICLKRYEHIPGDRYTETRVSISDLTPIPDQTGTCDLAICGGDVLVIVDWKYGTGIIVYAKDNTQLLLYAWGFFQQYDSVYNFQTIQLHIAQPRLNHFDVWEITRTELIEFADWARERAHAAWKQGADRHPSPKACQWCKCRTECPALEIARQALADQTFDVLDEPIDEANMNAVVVKSKELPPAVQLSTEQLAHILRYRKLMEGWLSDIADELTTRCLNGEHVEGWKIVAGRSRRRYVDEQAAAEQFRKLGLSDDDIYERKLISPNKSEPLLRAAGIRGPLTKKFLKTLVEQPPGRPTLVPDGDNRGEVPNLDVFDVEESEADPDAI